MLFRKKQKILEKNLENRKIIFFIWPRQVWKTTILKNIFNNIETKNKLFLNLEILDYHSFFKDFSSIKNLLFQNKFDKKTKFFLFLDEFHKVENISWVLKSLYDEFENLKIVVTWSNNIEINKNITESFAWRKRVINCYSLDFEEFIVWREKIDISIVKSFIQNPLNKAKNEFYLEEFLKYWWYPEVVKAEKLEDKKQEFQDIFSFWFNKDIMPEIKKDYKFNQFLKQIAFRCWDMLNINKIASDIWVSQPTVQNYFYLLQESLLIYPVTPFFKNKLKEIVKMPKIYFSDIWFRNFLINRFDFIDKEYWVLFENFIYSELLKSWKYFGDIKYWRTKNGSREVDFILELENKVYELKYKNRIKDSDLKWIKSFLSLYPNFGAKVLNKENFYEEILSL